MKQRFIKKYANRRLYDETSSRYVNFDELHELILQGETLKIIVDKTEEDQTLKVLFQIFLNLELSGKHIFSDQALRFLIILKNSQDKNILNIFLKDLSMGKFNN